MAFVGAVIYLATGLFLIINRAQDCVCHVHGIPARNETQASIGQDDERTLVEGSARQAPFERQELMWPIDDRVAHDRGLRMQSQNFALGLRYSPSESPIGIRFGLNSWLGLWCRHWQARRKERIGCHVASSGSDRTHGHEPPYSPLEMPRQQTRAPVRRNNQIEFAFAQSTLNSLGEVRITVDVLNGFGNLIALVSTAVEESDLEAAGN